MGRALRIAGWSAGGLLLAAAVAGGAALFWLDRTLASSLPQLEGSVRLPSLGDVVWIERDERGVPLLRASSRTDLARGLGFLHAQERFFQMDLLRRRAAGELAELFGRAALPLDRRHRVHRFRRLSRRSLEQSGRAERDLLEAYAQGVNAGLGALGSAPPEYLVLRASPRPWRPEDSFLVLMSMYLELQVEQVDLESAIGLVYDRLPEPLGNFLLPRGSDWDAPLLGGPLRPEAPPDAASFDLRRAAPPAPEPRLERIEAAEVGRGRGSNAWAVAGTRTRNGRAILANDMHLGLGLPNVWYRAAMVWGDPGGDGPRRIAGVTLPGTPLLVAGSNGHLAWGFTNSYADLLDLVLLEPGDEPDTYLTAEGPRRLSRSVETIRVRDGAEETLEVLSTIWGPLVDRDHRGRARALRWVAHDAAGANLLLQELEQAGTVDEALALAPRCGIPTQNLVLADETGRVGWTLIGPLPRRFGHDGRRPTSWADGSRGWNGFLPAADYPRLVDPPQGIVWSANHRSADEATSALLGDGGYDLGARATQIRDALLALEDPSVTSMLALQLDDRALLLGRWRALLLDSLTEERVGDDPRRRELRRLVEQSWTGRASVDSAGYRLVRAFRLVLAEQVFGAITASCREVDGRFDYLSIARWEVPLWALLEQRPPHLLHPRRAGWDEQILAAVDATLDFFGPDAGELERRTWGERNTIVLRHPLSPWLGTLSGWVDLPPVQLPGDWHMPRVQSPVFGASQRMVLVPGEERDSLLHTPGGASGHFRSPHYSAGHEAWVEGRAAPLLPGPPAHRLLLVPSG